MNNDKKLAKELTKIFNNLEDESKRKNKNNGKRKNKEEDMSFFGPEAKSLFTEPSKRPPQIRRGGNKKKTMKKKSLKKKSMKKKSMKKKSVKKYKKKLKK
tara:strand:+ start:309 stop:608 length:300 start_codon:yes stop_codon:yes gene_type:complete